MNSENMFSNMRPVRFNKCNYITHHKFYALWKNLKYSKKYSGVCDDWKVANVFFKWAEEHTQKDTVLSIINKQLPASPANCKFILRSALTCSAHATHELSRSPSYQIWKNIKYRYGEKALCKSWQDLKNFNGWYISNSKRYHCLKRKDKKLTYNQYNCVFI